MEKTTVSITMWGDNDEMDDWCEWYSDCKKIFEILGYKMTHLGIISEKFTNAKIMTVSRSEKTIVDALKNGEKPYSFSCYSLPKDYKSASFDYDLLLVRKKEYISLVVNIGDYDKVIHNGIVSILETHIKMKTGKIYQMDRNEMPLIYASKANPIESFKTLKIYEEITTK